MQRNCKTVLDSRPWSPDSGLYQWNLDSGFQSLVWFRIPWAIFQISMPTIPDSTCKNFSDSRIWIPESGFPYLERDNWQWIKPIQYISRNCFNNWSLAIGHWVFGHTDLTAMICLSDNQTIASQCATPNAQSNVHSEEKLSRHVAMIAKFLDLNQP